MHMTTLKQKIMLIIIGLFTAFLLGEAFLRVARLLVNKRSVTISASAGNRNSYRVLCLGDSSTYGLGSTDAKKNSYPSQLQRLLDNYSKDKQFEVINKGFPGANSSQVLNRLEQNISKYKPDMVIMMVGVNDYWNLEESNLLDYYEGKSIYRELMMRYRMTRNRILLLKYLKLLLISHELRLPDSDPNAIIKIPPHSEGDPTIVFQDPKATDAWRKALYSNVSEMINIARENNTYILFMKYHRPQLVDTVYTNFDVPLVDHHIIFKEAEKAGMDVISKDGFHPNDLGYALMARNIFNKLVLLNIVDSRLLKIFQ